MAQSSSSPPDNTTSSPRIGLPTSPSPRLSQQSTGSSAHSHSSASWEHQNSISEEPDQHGHAHQPSLSQIPSNMQQPQHWHCFCQHHTCQTQEASRSVSSALEERPYIKEPGAKSKLDSDGGHTKFLQKFKGAISSKLSRQKQQTPLPSMDGLVGTGEIPTKSFSKHRQQHLVQQQDTNYTEVVIDHWAE